MTREDDSSCSESCLIYQTLGENFEFLVSEDGSQDLDCQVVAEDEVAGDCVKLDSAVASSGIDEDESDVCT